MWFYGCWIGRWIMSVVCFLHRWQRPLQHCVQRGPLQPPLSKHWDLWPELWGQWLERQAETPTGLDWQNKIQSPHLDSPCAVSHPSPHIYLGADSKEMKLDQNCWTPEGETLNSSTWKSGSLPLVSVNIHPDGIKPSSSAFWLIMMQFPLKESFLLFILKENTQTSVRFGILHLSSRSWSLHELPFVF